MVRPAFSSIVQVRIGAAKLPDDIALMLVDGWVDQGIGVPAPSASPSATPTTWSSAS